MRNSKSKIRMTNLGCAWFRIWVFVIWICFGFRISTLGFRTCFRSAFRLRPALPELRLIEESEVARFRGLCPAHWTRAGQSVRSRLSGFPSRLPELCRLGSGLGQFLRALVPAYLATAPSFVRVG